MKHDLVPFRGVFEILRRAPLSFLYGSSTWVHIDLSDVTVSRKTPYIENTAVALRGMRMSALRNEWGAGKNRRRSCFHAISNYPGIRLENASVARSGKL